MFEDQATEVFNLVIADPANEAMRGRWRDSVDEYPPMMKNVLKLTVNNNAVKWIDENCPNAWYRGVFVNEEQS